MIVHPSAGIYSGTLVNALLYHCKDLSGINGVNRPGIVHRIDKETSGLLMVAKNDKAHKSLSEQLKEHSVTRRYVALVHGVIPHVHGKSMHQLVEMSMIVKKWLSQKTTVKKQLLILQY